MIRDYRPEDGPAVVELLRRLESLWPVTLESLVDDERRQPAEAMRRVWVADGGYAVARRLWEQQPAGSAMVWVGVVPERRRRGLRNALLEAALGHLVAVGGVDQACSADEPGVDIQWSFEEFERTELGRPTLDHDGSFVALADGAPVAMSIIFRAGPVAHNGFTCTHRTGAAAASRPSSRRRRCATRSSRAPNGWPRCTTPRTRRCCASTSGSATARSGPRLSSSCR